MNEYGFLALPGGGSSEDGSFVGYWWRATEYNSNIAFSRHMHSNYDNAYWNGYYKFSLCSARCVQD
jgi:uncharacterized protein (TIGR02145 family)